MVLRRTLQIRGQEEDFTCEQVDTFFSLKLYMEMMVPVHVCAYIKGFCKDQVKVLINLQVIGTFSDEETLGCTVLHRTSKAVRGDLV